MTDKEFLSYVNEQRRQGVADNRIARNLGMNLAHFLGKLNGTGEKAKEFFTAAPVKKEKPTEKRSGEEKEPEKPEETSPFQEKRQKKTYKSFSYDED